MAIFDSKKNKTPKKEKVVKEKKAPAQEVKFGILKNPRITEKATFVSEKTNIYTFDVATSANEAEVKKAINALYGVTPLKVNLLKVRGKQTSRGGIRGQKSSGKKAYVYLKEGDKIEFA